MKHLIITCSDSKYGDFLTEHWIVSLKENINLNNVDVVVLDYGLTESQIEIIKLMRIKLIKCVRDGHVTSLRYRDLLTFLQKENYDQVLMVDGGDIIFQSDISNLFEENKNNFRVVTETVSINFEYFYQKVIKSKKLRKEVISLLEGKEVINGGFILASSAQLIQFCLFYLKTIKHLKSHGIDQVLINYYLYKYGFVSLDKTYNFMLISNFHSDRYLIKHNKFYTSEGQLIAVVHNLGGINLMRGMKNFGYETIPYHNKMIHISKIGNNVINLFFKFVVKLRVLIKLVLQGPRTKDEK
ncbi:glycosyl transferase family 8 [Candidatus Dojkabacteria bacterium]|nr:glycosyl transferase family 8 [Candidatus Dojkabacteria bacterium]